MCVCELIGLADGRSCSYLRWAGGGFEHGCMFEFRLREQELSPPMSGLQINAFDCSQVV